MIRGDRAREIRRLNKEREAARVLEEESERRMQRATQKEAIEVSDSDEEGIPRPSQRNRTSSSPIEVVSSSFPNKTGAQLPITSERKLEERAEEDVEEEVDRIDIVMKGGQGGILQANVKVKPTTQIQRLLDHYVQLHKKEIPKDNLKSIRIRFDGEWINPKSTVGELGLEDDDQIDVIW